MSVHTFGFLCALGLLAVPVTPIEILMKPIGTTVASAPKNLDCSEQTEIVEKHNALRRGVNPTASNMLKMHWNKETATNAQKWADTCSMKHSVASARKINSSKCGENLYMSSRKNPWSNAVQAWYNEVKDWRYGVGSHNNGVVGHFTQVVWYRSNQIGCGMAFCPNSRFKYFYVCQYCPPGNYQFARPYKSGPSCGDCPNSCDDKLCTNACPHTDKYSNCYAYAMKKYCKYKAIATACAASCKCTNNEII